MDGSVGGLFGVTSYGFSQALKYNRYKSCGNISSKAKQTVVDDVLDKTDDVANMVDDATSGSKTKTLGFDEWINKGSSDNKVYFRIDKNNYPKYTGITKQTKLARLAQHNKNGKSFLDLEIQYENLTKNQARAIEQYFIENGPNELNKINSIGQNNKYYQDALNWANQYLGK